VALPLPGAYALRLSGDGIGGLFLYMSLFGNYTGSEFFDIKFPERKFLVDKIMREKDSVLFVGSEKSGKSVLIKQLICSLTSQHPFLDEYEVLKPSKVSYIQLEGELSDSQDRFNRMIRSLDFNRDLFHIKYSAPLRLQEDAQIKQLIREIKAIHIPDVIIIDPLYFSLIGGSLSDDMHVIRFIGNIRIMKDYFGCAVIIVHHTHKVKMEKGQIVIEGDDAIFGSVFLKAWPDHLLLFVYDKKSGLRHLSCGTQRSGDIIRNISLEMIQPDPLYFKKKDEEQEPGSFGKIIEILSKPEHKDGLTADQVCELTDIKRRTFYKSVKNLLEDGTLRKKSDNRPVVYVR